jgi:hypothetical protein
MQSYKFFWCDWEGLSWLKSFGVKLFLKWILTKLSTLFWRCGICTITLFAIFHKIADNIRLILRCYMLIDHHLSILSLCYTSIIGSFSSISNTVPCIFHHIGRISVLINELVYLRLSALNWWELLHKLNVFKWYLSLLLPSHKDLSSSISISYRWGEHSNIWDLEVVVIWSLDLRWP